MYCDRCQTVTLEGERCRKCGEQMLVFQPPRADFDKKGELRQKTRELLGGDLDPQGFSAYLDQQLAKLSKARQILGSDAEDGHLLIQAFDLWQQALERAQSWMHSRSDWDLQAAMALATQVDLQLQVATLHDWEKTRDLAVALQELARLKGFEPRE